MYRVCTTLCTAKIGPQLWILTEPMAYITPRGIFVVPAGYLTDHASVPRLLTSVVPPVKSCVAEGSVLHDWFYNRDSPEVPRAFADECLRELTLSRGGSKALGYITWGAVRVGGWNLYRRELCVNKLLTAYPAFQNETPESILNIIKHKGLKKGIS